MGKFCREPEVQDSQFCIPPSLPGVPVLNLRPGKAKSNVLRWNGKKVRFLPPPPPPTAPDSFSEVLRFSNAFRSPAPSKLFPVLSYFYYKPVSTYLQIRANLSISLFF